MSCHAMPCHAVPCLALALFYLPLMWLARACEFYLASVAVAWAVPGGFMKVGLGLLHAAGGINVASRWGCVQGV